jgi:hypothetical protein
MQVAAKVDHRNPAHENLQDQPSAKEKAIRVTVCKTVLVL